MLKITYLVETKLTCIEWFHSIPSSATFYLHTWGNLTKYRITDAVKSTEHVIVYR
ncbi:hypothetical protein K6V33_03385 [Streptococcus suis]|nr:hypothetical protein [Streptococcus suis]